MKKLSGIFLAILAFFSSTLNVFADAVEVYEEKTQTINKEDYESLKEQIEKKVFELNESDDEYVYDYEISITKEEDEIIVTDTKKVTSEQKFTSEEDAKKYYEEYELEDSWKQGELTITSNEEAVVANGETITITCAEETCTEEIAALQSALNEYQELEVISKNTTSTDDTKVIVYQDQELLFEEALRLIATLNPEVEGYSLVKNEYVLVKKGSIDAKTFKELVGKDTYETYAEAKEAADKFLANDDYEDKVAVIAAIYDDSEREKTTKESIGFLNEELAWTAAIAQATAELEQAIANGEIELAKTLEETKAALEKAYETGKLGLTGMELDGKIVYYSLPELRLKETTETYTQSFYTKTAAELAKAALEAINESSEETGISYEDITITETGEDTTIVSETVPVYAVVEKTYPLIPTSKNYYSLRNGNKMVIWTKDALTSDKKDEITKSLKENDNTISTIEFINGFNEEKTIDGIGTFTFKETGRYFKVYSIEVSNYDLSVETGIITTGKKYELSYKQITSTELWYYDRTEVKLGFDYIITGGGLEVTRDLFKVQSTLTGKIYDYTMNYRVNTTEKYTSYVASFDLFKEETKTNATVAYKITREKATTGTVIPDEEENKDQNQEQTPGAGQEGETITPPNTGVEVNFFLQGALLISILVAVASLKKLCK